MTLYARPNPDSMAQNDVRDFATPPPIEKGWRPLTVNVQPVPTASQALGDAGFAYTPTTATQPKCCASVVANHPRVGID